MKKAKGIWTAAALAVGLGLGFGVAFSPAPAHAEQGAIECARDSDCYARCGGPGTGVCELGQCRCNM